MHRHMSAASTVVALAALIGGTAPAALGAGTPTQPRVTALRPLTSAAVHTVRLITGDTVVVTGTGTAQTVSFQPDSDSPQGIARIDQNGAQITVVPEEVRSLLDSGALDPRLFDIDGLIAQGYSDGADLPLIVRGEHADVTLPSGAGKVRKLHSLKSAATRVAPTRIGRFWSGLRSRQKGASGKKLASGVEKVWLDGKVKATLADSVPQIGAPEAWAAGKDGSGVKVAVLDTGVDQTHPDLAGRVGEARNFTDADDAVDHHGHGTHVASTVAGSGAASGGKNKGVAPGAELLVGKVLNDQGSGSDSWVLAGMDWAAHSGAKVVSMSLGTSAASDGTDPLSEAVDQLTAETGTLFVIAAGNTGPGATTVGSPGSADAALTVAAVDKQDKLASFSSRGPRLGDDALKPDIAAPGVNIVAARAASTSMGTPVNESYTSASGTSMATPHVAGAAAILAQAHPDWKAPQLKGALMSSAKVLAGGAFAEGSGRVDVPASLGETVWADNASFGTVPATGSTAPMTRKVTFHNTADHQVTLSLAGDLQLDGGAVAPGALTLGADTLILPAGGSGDVDVTVTPDNATKAGTYTGTVTATGDGVTAHATVALNREQPTMQLKFKAVMPDGSPATAASAITLRDLEDSDQPPMSLRLGDDGVATAQVTPGRYTIFGHLRRNSDFVTFGLPDIEVGEQDVSLVADGRDARPIKARTPQRSELRSLTLSVGRKSDAQSIGASSTYVLGRAGGHQWALPSAKPKDGTFGMTVNWTLQSPPIVAKAQLPDGLLDLQAESFSFSGRFDGTRRLTAVDVGNGSEAEIAADDVKGKLVIVRWTTLAEMYNAVSRLAEAGAAAIMYVNTADERLPGSVPTTVPVFGVPKSRGDQLAQALTKRPVDVKLTVEKNPSYLYGLVRGEVDGIPADQTFAPAKEQFADIAVKTYSPAANPDDIVNSQDGWLGVSNITRRGTGSFTPMSFGTSQHVYVNAKNTQWQRIVLPGNGASMVSMLRPYEPGKAVTEEWYKPVQRPTSPVDVHVPATGMTPSRNDQEMLVQIPVWASPDGHFYEGASVAPGDVDEFRVYRDGELLGTTPYPYASIAGLPAQSARYRFELDAKRTQPWWQASTETHTAWTFTSTKPADVDWHTLPLLHADYDLAGVEIGSSVRPLVDHKLTVAFRGADSADSPLTKSSVEVSYDGGRTWQRPHAETTARTVTVGLRAPKGADSVSLRVKGENAAGSAIEQTVIDAVRVAD